MSPILLHAYISWCWYICPIVWQILQLKCATTLGCDNVGSNFFNFKLNCQHNSLSLNPSFIILTYGRGDGRGEREAKIIYNCIIWAPVIFISWIVCWMTVKAKVTNACIAIYADNTYINGGLSIIANLRHKICNLTLASILWPHAY